MSNCLIFFADADAVLAFAVLVTAASDVFVPAAVFVAAVIFVALLLS